MKHRKHPDVPSSGLSPGEIQAFTGSVTQRILHNDLVALMETAQGNLETFEGDDLIRQQGFVKALHEAFRILHQKDSIAVRQNFGYE